MRLIEIATKRRVTIMMFTVAVIMFGMVSLSRLKVNLLPDLSYPTITVRTELTGAAPIEIESLVTKPVEEAVGVIRNVRQVRSVSRTGQSDVVLEFAWGTDMDIAGVDVREKLDILQLPLEASRSMLLRFDPSSEPVMRLALIEDPDAKIKFENDEGRLKALRRYAEDQLKTDLEASDGTAAVKTSGGLEDEIQILVDQVRLAQLGISIETVTERIRQENVNLSGGRLEQGSQRFLVRTINEFQNVDEIANSIVANVDGRVIYMRDVAEITRGFKEREAITRVNGQESVELSIYKEGDANTVQVANRIKQRLANTEKNLPANMKLITIYDQSKFIADAISQVRSAALLGGLLAILVLYFFLRDARATFIIGAAIPVSVIGTFLMMYSSNISLNIMSLGGIALAIGMLVDNSIVVLENIVRKKESGLSMLEASREGASEVATAVIASTLTTIAVFFPMVFVTGIAGQLFKDQALTVTFALVFSLIVALTLIPMLAALGAEDRFADSTDDRPPALLTRIIGWLVRMIRKAFSGFAWIMNKLLR
ncbi:MAG: efflux RND transporter permease subunit, partial [Gammaproteobacteria bacterium]|nr:efflux RND transporter permease subunit [Gammaproteobacteria bacterium]